MNQRKLKTFLTEMWSHYSIVLAMYVAVSPFMSIIFAAGYIFPVTIFVLSHIIAVIVLLYNASEQTNRIIQQENKTLLNTLRGVK
jgi:hypothetical protein